ncbi:MAG TPA: hypothetical protein VN682_28340 [Terriglobales bacterium]|jgi:hypothetical protein|nr:hypothetical protein [Terriglobales bacterium]
MRTLAGICVFAFLVTGTGSAASKPHAVGFGKWSEVKVLVGDDESTPAEMKIRPLIVDGRVKEFTTGIAHDVTDRIFVVQRAYRLNDLLPQESGSSRWRWQRGGWLLVDRTSGRVQAIALPAFDAYYSQVSWFRDYAAYCGLSDDASMRFSVVVQLGRRKPLLKKSVGEKSNAPANASCPPPVWARAPVRVTFDAPGEAKFAFIVRTQAVDLVTEEDDEGGN